MRVARMLALILAVLAAAATPASAQVQLPAKPQTVSLDSDAPPGSPPHWLPGEQWVMQHWLPYDERRLYSLLGVDRGAIWRMLRDDTRNLAQLAQDRGMGAGRARARARRAVAREAAQPRAARAARAPGAAHAHPGPPRPAPVLPLAAPGGDPLARDQDLRRREPRGVVDAAALRAQPAADLPPQRPPARARAGAGGGDAARVRRPGRRAPVDPGRAGGAAALAPAAPAPALAAADALQRPAARAHAAVLARHGVELLQQRGAVGRRPARRVRELPGQARDRQAARRDRGDGARRRRRRAARARERRGGRPALELQPGAVGRRALGRVRVRARQPQLREALRAHGGPGPRPAQRPHDQGQPPARAHHLALGLQPDDLGRRAADRLRGL